MSYHTGKGQAYIFSCPYSSLCKQVVTDQEGKVAEFDFEGSDPRVLVTNGDDDLTLGVDSIVAIPLSEWSLDYVTPSAQCTRDAEGGGRCVEDVFPMEPEGSQVIPLVDAANGRPVRGEGGR